MSSFLGEDAAKNAGEAAVNTATTNYGNQGYARNASQNILQNGTGVYAPTFDTSGVGNPYASQTSGLVSAIGNQPSLTDNIKSQLSDFDQLEAPNLANQYAAVAQKAAATGRLGNQGVTSDYGNVLQGATAQRQQLEDQLVGGAAQQQVQDQLAQLNAVEGAGNQATQLGEYNLGLKNSAAQQTYQDQSDQQKSAIAEALGLGQFGFSNSPVSAQQQYANELYGQAGANTAGFGKALGALGSLFMPGPAGPGSNPGGVGVGGPTVASGVY